MTTTRMTKMSTKTRKSTKSTRKVSTMSPRGTTPTSLHGSGAHMNACGHELFLYGKEEKEKKQNEEDKEGE